MDEKKNEITINSTKSNRSSENVTIEVNNSTVKVIRRKKRDLKAFTD